MTRDFNVRYTCEHCHRQTKAQTAFGKWMRENKSLDSHDGIVRTDTDHVILRYKTSLDGRDFQLLMIVEVKEWGAEPNTDQVDIFSFIHQMMVMKKRTPGDAVAKSKPTGIDSYRLYSRKNKRWVRVRYFGLHLLQFEKTGPEDSDWIKWDRKTIDEQTLTALIAMELRPDNPKLRMVDYLRDRHSKKTDQLPLLET